MSKEIKSKAEHRSVDGEVVTAEIDKKIQRGREFSAQKAEGANSDDFAFEDERQTLQDPDSILKDVDPNKTLIEDAPQKKFFKRHSKSIIVLSLFALLLAVIWYSRPSLDWQVEKINDLQQEVAYLQEQNQLIQEQLQEQSVAQQELIDNKISEAMQNNDQQGLVDETKLQEVKAELQAQLQNLQSKLANVTASAGEDISSALSEFNSQAESLMPETTAQLKVLEETVQTQFGQFAKELDTLLAFKDKQEAESLAAQSEVEVKEESQPQLAMPSPLNSMRIQQWIIEINTQWMLNDHFKEIRGQLLALEQAASLSDFQYTSQLARLIGQDLSYIQQFETQQLDEAVLKTQNLKEAIVQLQLDNLPNQATVNSGQGGQVEQSQGDTNNLLDKFGQLFSVKKRDEEASFGQVNKLLLNDVLKQRLALLVDRLEWGVSTRSESIIQQSTQDFKDFIKAYYPNNISEFNDLLNPFNNLQFNLKQPLNITRLDQEIER